MEKEDQKSGEDTLQTFWNFWETCPSFLANRMFFLSSNARPLANITNISMQPKIFGFMTKRKNITRDCIASSIISMELYVKKIV